MVTALLLALLPGDALYTLIVDSCIAALGHTKNFVVNQAWCHPFLHAAPCLL